MSAYDSFTHDHYRAVLGAARDAGYRFIGYADLDEARRSAEPALIMRHDCDNDLAAAFDMAKIEAESGIRTTYCFMLRAVLYNFLAPPNIALARRILELGHHAALHFDPGLDEPSNELIIERAERDRAILADELGVPIDVVSFHQPTQPVLDNTFRLKCLHTYDKQDMEGVFYASDSNMTFRHGTPEAWLATVPHRLVQMLIHPEWWTPEPMPIAEKWKRMMENNKGLAVACFRQRERSYE